MPLLAGWISSLFASLAGYFAIWFTRRVAMITAGVAAFSVLVVALYSGFAVLVASLVVAFPSGALSTGIWLFIPDNTPMCLASMISADAALNIFFWQRANLAIALRGAS